MCRELAGRGVTLLEADTDGVYFAVPEGWNEADERRVVAEVAALLPPRVQLEFEGRYAAMLSHEPKNTRCCGTTARSSCTVWRSVRAVRSRSARHSCAERSRNCSRATSPVSARPTSPLWMPSPPRVADARCVVPGTVTKTPAEYFEVRDSRRELPYEAMLASGRKSWSIGDRIRVYRTKPAGAA